MNKWLEILFGLILLITAILISIYSLNWGIWNFGTAAWEIFKGGLIWIVILIGLVLIMIGISDLKD